MARIRVIENAMNGGEWSPLLEGRSDLNKYHNAVKTMENMICFRQGGASRRPGTHFVAEVKTSAKSTRIIPFIFSTIQPYIIEVGDLYMRFYKNSARIESPPATAVEIATPYLEAELFDIHFTQSADTLYLAHGSHAPMQLTRTSDIAWTLSAITFLDGPYLPERSDLTITPSATTGTVTLTASSAVFLAGHVGSFWRIKQGAAWGYAKVTVFTDTTHVTALVITAFASTAASTSFREGAWSTVRGFPSSVTLFQQRSWWGGTSNNPDTIWGSASTNYINMNPGTALASDAITFTLASNQVNAIRWMAPSRALLAGTSGQEWNLSGGAVSDPITPSAINARAETTHGSSNISPVQVHNAVLFLQRSGNRLREYTYDFYSDSYSAPDLTLLADHMVKLGILQLDYQQELNSVVWAIRKDGALLGMTYERPQDVVAWHRHITGNQQDFTDGQFQSVAVIPHPTVNEDQTWVVVNRSLSRNVPIISIIATPISSGSPPHVTGRLITYYAIAHGFAPTNAITVRGTSSSFWFDGSFTVNTVIDADHFTVIASGSADFPPNGTGGFVSIANTQKRYVEYLDTQGGFYGSLQTDAALTYSGVAASTLSGLSHLEGQVVDILGNGAVYPQQIVTSGQVTGLSPQVTQAEVGLHFNSTILTMRPEAGADQGTAQGARKRFSEVAVRLDNSLGVTINGDQLEFRTSTNPMDAAPPLFTGDKRVDNLGWDRDGRIEIKQTQPLPLTVLAIMGVLTVTD